MYPPLQHHREEFHRPKNPVPLIHPSPESWQLIFYCHHNFAFPECHFHILGLIKYISFSDWLLLPSNMYLNFFHVFSWIDSLFIFTTEQYSIIWCTTVCLSTHLLKDILAASKFCQLWISCYKHACAAFSVKTSFWLIWTNI